MTRHHNQPDRDPRPEDTHLAFGEMRDPAAWLESIKVDAADDRRWLQAHPEAEFRKRSISVREIRATGDPPDTIVMISRGPDGSQIRSFHPPGASHVSIGGQFSRN
jgi:hypothetical protein